MLGILSTVLIFVVNLFYILLNVNYLNNIIRPLYNPKTL